MATHLGDEHSIPPPSGGTAPSESSIIERFGSGPLRRVLGGMLRLSDLLNTRAASVAASARWRCAIVRARILAAADAPAVLRFSWPCCVGLTVDHVEQIVMAFEYPEDDVLSPSSHPLMSALKGITSAQIIGVLDEEGSTALVTLLPHLTSLHSLHLASNGFGDQGCDALAAVLPQMKVLRKLGINGNYIGSVGCTALAAVLPQMKLLSKLDMRHNGIGDQGCTALAAVLPQMELLSNLGMTCNPIGDKGCIALIAALPHIKRLSSLDMSGNYIGYKGCTALAAVLPQMKLLSTLDMSCNQIGTVGYSALVAALPKMTSLSNLDISDNGMQATVIVNAGAAVGCTVRV